MLENQKNSRIQGNVGLGSAIAYFCLKGWNVSLPLTDSQEYDLVVDIDGKLNKVQVKTTYAKSPYGIYTVCLKTSGGNKSCQTIKLFDPTKVDYLFILTQDNEKYFIPCSESTPKNTMKLGKQYQQFKII
jgi:hypothetical protein